MRFMPLLVVIALSACRNEHVGQDDQVPLTAERTESVVRAIANEFRTTYVAPEVGENVAATLLDSLGRDQYVDVRSPQELAERLTADLRRLTHDVHVRVAYGSAAGADPSQEISPGEELMQAAPFPSVDRLRGNIGYIKVAVFSVPRIFEPDADAAVRLLSGTDALIIDVRDTPGGHGASVAYLCSFFFASPTHINTFVDREGRATEVWTRTVPAHYLDKPVYILTSGATGSAAEGFSYAMKTLGRATIVGETTVGGAHTGMYKVIDSDFPVFVPSGRSESPVTSTNWEGVGVQPDLESSAAAALSVAVNHYMNSSLARQTR